MDGGVILCVPSPGFQDEQYQKESNPSKKKIGIDLLHDGFNILKDKGEKAFLKFVESNKLSKNDVESIRGRAEREKN